MHITIDSEYLSWIVQCHDEFGHVGVLKNAGTLLIAEDGAGYVGLGRSHTPSPSLTLPCEMISMKLIVF